MTTQSHNSRILDKALVALRKHLSVEILNQKQIDQTDFDLSLLLNDSRLKIVTKIKPHLRNEMLGPIIGQIMMAEMLESEPTALLVSNYINPTQAAFLKEKNVNFIDTMGNCFIQYQNVYVYVIGNARPSKPEKDHRQRLWKASGLKFIFALLSCPGLESKSYRTITAASGISVGSVDWLLNELRDAGHLQKSSDGQRRLVNKRKLLDRWVIEYPDELRPKLLLGRHSNQDLDLLTKKLSSFIVGGQRASYNLGLVTNEKNTSLYILDEKKYTTAPTINSYENGDIEVLKKFWFFENKGEFVPPILMFADLLALNEPDAFEFFHTHVEPLLIESNPAEK